MESESARNVGCTGLASESEFVPAARELARSDVRSDAFWWRQSHWNDIHGP